MTELPERPAHLDKPWTAHEVLFGLFNHLVTDGWAPLTEVSAAAPVDWRDLDAAAVGKSRRIDMLAIRLSPGGGDEALDRLALEVKVSRRDFLADVRNPDKQAAWRALADRHAFVVPEGLVTAEEVPDGSGLMTVARWPEHEATPPTVTWAKPAPRNPDPLPLSPWLIQLVALRAAWADADRKGLTFTSAQRRRHEIEGVPPGEGEHR